MAEKNLASEKDVIDQPKYVGRKGGEAEVECTPESWVECRDNPGGALAAEEDKELNISGRYGGPKLPKAK